MRAMIESTVSVIIPVYNGDRYLAEALQSVIRQTRPAQEILVVDDGSTDHSAEVAEGFPEVRVLKKAHSGLAPTLNLGVSQAGGQVFAFLDADDRWLPDKLALQLSLLEQHPEFDMVFGHACQFSLRQGEGASGENFSEPQQAVCKSAMLIRRESFEKVGEFSESADRHDFLDWYGRALAANLHSAILPDLIAERRVHDLNVGRIDSATQRRQYLSTLRAIVQQRRT